MTTTLEVEAPPGPTDKLVRVDLGDLMQREPPATRYVFEPIIPRRVATLLGGHGGMGKSVLALTLAAHATCGRKWGPFPAVQCRAVYVSLEDDADTVRYRLRRIIEAYNLPADAVVAALQVFDGSDADATLAMEVSDDGIRRLMPTALMERVGNACNGAGLIVVDNASDAYGGNENERRQVRTFIRALTQLARANDAGLLLLAHIDKSAARNGGNGNAYSGSTAWHNSVRSRIALLSEGDGIVLTHEKAQYSKPAEPVRLAFAEHGVLVTQDASTREAAADAQAAADADSVLAALKAAIAAGVTVPAAATGPATAWRTLADFPELADEFRSGTGKQRVSAAIVRLVRDRRVVRVTYKKPNRHEGERLELAQSAPIPASESARQSSPHTPLAELTRAGAARQSRKSASFRTGAELAHGNGASRSMEVDEL